MMPGGMKEERKDVIIASAQALKHSLFYTAPGLLNSNITPRPIH